MWWSKSTRNLKHKQHNRADCQYYTQKNNRPQKTVNFIDDIQNIQKAKKTGHFASVCRSAQTTKRQKFTNFQLKSNIQQPTGFNKNFQPRKIRRVKESEQPTINQEEESLDAEAALYIRELAEEQSNINLITPYLSKTPIT